MQDEQGQPAHSHTYVEATVLGGQGEDLLAASGEALHTLHVGEAQGLPVAGYKATQPQWAIDAVNDFKHHEERVLRRMEALAGMGVDGRMLAIGKTQLQIAFMAINRAVFQPGRVDLPEDEHLG